MAMLRLINKNLKLHFNQVLGIHFNLYFMTNAVTFIKN